MAERRIPALPRRRALGALAAGASGCALAAFGITAARSGGGDPPPTANTGANTAADPAGDADVGRPGAAAVSRILENRARAVRDGDRIAFMATVALAPPGFRKAQATLFDNLAKLPVEGWREHMGAVVSTEGGAATVRIDLRYRLKGYDPAPLARTRHLAFAPRAGGWVIVGDGSGRGLADDPEIWDGPPITVVEGRAALVAGDATGLDAIARRLDAAVPDVTDVLGRDWARRAVALAPADPSRAVRLAGGRNDLGRIAALATTVPTGRGPAADRIVVSPAYARLNELGRTVVLTHELTHVATGGAADGDTPVWLIEGLADYVGYRGTDVGVRSAARELRREVAAGRVPAALPSGDDFAAGSARLSQSYQGAWLACRMIAERYGEAALVRLYRAARRRPAAAALRDVLGLDPAALTSAWRDYLRKELA